MSDQDFAAHVEQLRVHQEQTDQSLVTLADAIEDLIKQAEGHPLSETALSGDLANARQAVAAVRQRHQSNRRI
jgi:hypothetical protein